MEEQVVEDEGAEVDMCQEAEEVSVEVAVEVGGVDEAGETPHPKVKERRVRPRSSRIVAYPVQSGT